MCFYLLILLALGSYASLDAKLIRAANDDLQLALNQAEPGDTILVSGVHRNFQNQSFFNYKYEKTMTRSCFQTVQSGRADAPITIKGDGTAVIEGKGTEGNDFGLCVIHDYYRIENLKISKVKKGLVLEHASHGVIDSVLIEDVNDEAFKFRYGSQYWLVKHCIARRTGIRDNNKTPGIGKRNGEGFYAGNASSNWRGRSKDNPDETAYITFVNCIAEDTQNDGFDFKEGVHHVKLIRCKVDWTRGIEPIPNAAQSDAGFYLRAKYIQLIDCEVIGSNHYNAAVKTASKVMNGISYVGSIELFGMKVKDFADNSGMLHLKSSPQDIALYDNYQLNGAAKYAITRYLDNPDSHKSPEKNVVDVPHEKFKELTWEGIGGEYYWQKPLEVSVP